MEINVSTRELQIWKIIICIFLPDHLINALDTISQNFNKNNFNYILRYSNIAQYLDTIE